MFQKPDNNSQIYDDYQTESAKVLALLKKQAHQGDSNDAPQVWVSIWHLFTVDSYPSLS